MEAIICDILKLKKKKKLWCSLLPLIMTQYSFSIVPVHENVLTCSVIIL